MKEHQKKAGRKREFIKFRAWMFFNIGWTILYLIWRAFFTLPLKEGIVSVIAGVALLVVEILGMLEALVHYFNMSNIRFVCTAIKALLVKREERLRSTKHGSYMAHRFGSLRPQAICTAKIFNARFSANAGASKENNLLCLCDFFV